MVTATTLSEFQDYIFSLKRINSHSSTVSSFTFFRGQANRDWKLLPSLYREGLFHAENLLLTELQHICPEEFQRNRFDILTKMQHFGMPTRLLDMTTNPLVALYFACLNHSNTDGMVYVFSNLPVSWSNDPLIELYMDFIFEYTPTRLWLEQMLVNSKEKYKNVVHRLMPDDIQTMIYYLTIPSFAVMPAKTNPRILAQDGAFFIFGMNLKNRVVSTNPGTLGRVYYDFEPVSIDTPDQLWHNVESILIPSACKQTFLEQLDLLGINEKNLFPDLPHQIEYIVKRVKQGMV